MAESPILQTGQDSPLFRLEADLTEDAQFGTRHLIVSRDAVRVLDGADAEVLRVPITDIADARSEPLVSGGRVLLELKSGEEITVVRYSQTHSKNFSDAAHIIERLAKGEEVSGELVQDRVRCPKCGKLLPERNGVCPSCVNRGQTMMRISGFLGPYRKQAIYLAIVTTLTTILNLAPPKIQGAIIDSFSSGEKSLSLLYGMVALWAVVLIGSVILQVLTGRLMAFLAVHIAADLRNATFRAIEYLQVNYFDRKPVGAIASRVMTDTERVLHFLVDGLPFFLVNGLMLIGVLILLFVTNWLLALCILAPIPFVVVISMRVWKPISSMFHRVSQKTARVYMHLGESLMGIRVVKAFANEDHEYGRFTDRNRELRDATLDSEVTWHTAFGMMTFFTSIGIVINWTVGGWFLFTGRMTLGEFWMINAYLMLVYGPLQFFARINNWFSRAMAGAERIFEILDMVPESGGKTGEAIEIKGKVAFDGVRFGYEKSNPVLKEVSFEVEQGQMIGLVGHSGAGKSTIINLICRFYEPDAGRLVVDGRDVRDLDLHSYRSQIGIVLQEPFLFHGTIAENISYGRPGASLEEIMEAANAANAHDFILAKPEGYDTIVGERGARLSGGEKQRISIARAILHDPRILIFDEATSSVDVETEREIQEAINRLVSGRTTFAIAHRLSTLRNADRLIVMDRGEIVEEGSHEELMEKRGVFYKMVETQSRVNEIIGIGMS